MTVALSADTTVNVAARWFADRKIRTKILAAVLLVALVVTAAGLLAVERMGRMDRRLGEVRATNVQNLILLGQMRGAQASFGHNAAMQSGQGVTEAVRAKAQQGMAQAMKEIAAALDEYRGQPKTAAAQQELTRYTALWEQFTTAMQGMNTGQRPTIDIDAVVTGMITVLGQLSGQEQEDASQAVTAAHDSYLQARRQVLITLAAGFLLAIGLALLVARSITRRLHPVVQAMEAVASGDLTGAVPAYGRDEVGAMARAVNRATSSVRDTVTALAQGAGLLARSSGQLTQVTDDVVSSAAAASERAQVVDGSAGVVSQNLQTVAGGADQMAASIHEIARSANEGARVASQAVSLVRVTNETMTKLGDSSREIGDVVKVITSVAEQTNLLALNATIEAARAGDMGKGFAVVAGEVKDLAQETARATEEISQRVHAIQADTAGAVEAISQISGVIEKINELQTTIASAVEEQTATTAEINRNMATAAGGAAEIAANVAEVSNAADSTTRSVAAGRQAAGDLAGLAADLQQLVARFTYETH